MLSTQNQPDRLRVTRNFLPTARGGVEVRPGAVQRLDVLGGV